MCANCSCSCAGFTATRSIIPRFVNDRHAENRSIINTHTDYPATGIQPKLSHTRTHTQTLIGYTHAHRRPSPTSLPHRLIVSPQQQKQQQQRHQVRHSIAPVHPVRAAIKQKLTRQIQLKNTQTRNCTSLRITNHFFMSEIAERHQHN